MSSNDLDVAPHNQSRVLGVTIIDSGSSTLVTHVSISGKKLLLSTSKSSLDNAKKNLDEGSVKTLIAMAPSVLVKTDTWIVTQFWPTYRDRIYIIRWTLVTRSHHLMRRGWFWKNLNPRQELQFCQLMMVSSTGPHPLRFMNNIQVMRAALAWASITVQGRNIWPGVGHAYLVPMTHWAHHSST